MSTNDCKHQWAKLPEGKYVTGYIAMVYRKFVECTKCGEVKRIIKHEETETLVETTKM